MELKRDFFLQKYLKVNCYTINKKTLLKKLHNLKSPFFISYVNKNKLSKKDQLKYNCKYLSKLFIFKKNFIREENLNHYCRIAKNSDEKAIERLIVKSKTNSRFYLDTNIERKKIKRFRADWLKGYFKNKKGKKLFVCDIKKKIRGALLLSLNKKISRINLIAVEPNFARKSVASSLISYVNNFYMEKINYLIAGTQETNLSAIKLYKKNNFKFVNSEYYHHIYSKK